MGSCSAIKADGERCRGIAATGSQYCPAHDPARADARRRAATKAGRARPRSIEITQIKGQLQSLADAVQKGELEPRRGSVTSQILNILLRAHETEMKIKEHTEFGERLEALESGQERRYA